MFLGHCLFLQQLPELNSSSNFLIVGQMVEQKVADITAHYLISILSCACEAPAKFNHEANVCIAKLELAVSHLLLQSSVTVCVCGRCVQF